MKPKEELLINAIHEAGHVAACLNLELPFGDVYLDRPKGDDGIVGGLVRSTDIDYSSGVLTPEEESTSTYMVIAALAGPACEALHFGHVAFDITEYEDLDAVLDIIEYRFANNNVRMAFARYCEAEAFALFQDDRRLWRYANVLARELMREKKLTYAQCAELYNKEYLVESWVRKEVEEIRRMGGEATSVEARVEGKEKGHREKGQGPRPKVQEEKRKEQAAGDEQRVGKEVAGLMLEGVEGAPQPAEAQAGEGEGEERRGKRRRGRRRGGRRRGKGAREELRTEVLEGGQLPGEIEQLPGEIISSTQQAANAGQPPVPVQEGGTPKPREVPKQQREGVSERAEAASSRSQAAGGEERPRLQVIKKQPVESKEGALSDTEQDRKAIGTTEQGIRAEQSAATIEPKEAEARKQEPGITPVEKGLPEVKPEEARPAAAGAAKRRPIGKASGSRLQAPGKEKGAGQQAAGEGKIQERVKEAPGAAVAVPEAPQPVAAGPAEPQPLKKPARGRGGAKAGEGKAVGQQPQTRPDVPVTQGQSQKQAPGKKLKEEGKANVLEATGMKTTGVKAQGRAVQGTKAAHPDSIWEEEGKKQGSRGKVQETGAKEPKSKEQGTRTKVQETRPRAQEAKGKAQPVSGEKKETPKPVKAAKPRAAKAARPAPAKPAPPKGAARAAAPPAKKAAPKKAAPKKK